jgi:O-antigen ligase
MAIGGADLGERALLAAFGAVGLVAYLAPLGLALLMPVLAALLLWDGRGRHRAAWPGLRRSLLCLAPLGLLAILSALWAVTPSRAISEGLRLTLEIALGLALVHLTGRLAAERQCRALLLVAGGLGLACLIVLLDTVVEGGLTGWARHREINPTSLANAYSRGAVFHAIILPPLLIGLLRRRQRLAAALSLAAALAAIFTLRNSSAQLALVLGLGAGAAIYLQPRLGRLLLLGAAALTLTLPVLMLWLPDPAGMCGLIRDKPSAAHRLYIWRFVDGRILERPLLGWGMDASRTLPGGQETFLLSYCPENGEPATPVAELGLLPLHPHNALLQLWLELGGVGAIVGLAGLLALLWPVFSTGVERAGAAAAGGALAAGFSAAAVSFGAWQPWWVSSFFLCAALARSVAVGGPERPAQKRRISP